MNKLKSDKLTAFLTGAGGTALPYLISDLQSKGIRVLAGDMDASAAGMFFADKGFILPPGKSSDFFQTINRICKEEFVDVFIPLVDEELIASVDLERSGTVVLTPNKNAIETCLDKYKLSLFLNNVGIPVPKTCLVEDFGPNDFNFPVIIKPRTGRGSRGLSYVEKPNDFLRVLNESPYDANELIVQEAIIGDEYTVSVVVWRDGQVQSVVPKKIISKKKVTQLAVTEKIPVIEKLCIEIQSALKADGPMNVQLCMDKDGIPRVFEINPRFSTSTTLTINAGVDEVYGLIMQSIYGSDSYRFEDFTEDIVMIRRTMDYFIPLDRFNKVDIIEL